MSNDTDLKLEQAFSLYYENRFAECERLTRTLLKLEPDNHRAVFLLGHLAKQGGQLDFAIELFTKALAIDNNNPQYHFGLANTLRNRGRTEEAVTYLDSGLEREPNDPVAHQTLGSFLSDLGRFEASRGAFSRAIELDPGLGAAHYGLALIKEYQADDPHIKLMEEVVRDEKLDTQERSRIAFALGKAHEQTENYDRAFKYFDLGNRERRSYVNYSLDDDRRNTHKLIQHFNTELFQDRPDVGCESIKPIFVIGMPRSGSTLLEQVLSSHPEIAGAGELMALHETIAQQGAHFLPDNSELPEAITQIPNEAWKALGSHYVKILDQIAPVAARVIDKQLFNYTFVGMMALMLPKASIIHVARDPMDTCVSCYTNSFLADRGFTYDLDELGHAYKLYETLMAHWDKVLPNRIIHVQYEELVGNLETVARKLIDMIGLSWSDACLTYYQNKRPVTTSSLSQVRQPAYQSSLGRWRHYEAHLGRLMEILAEPGDET